ncbi:hypothetical protein [Prevotella melaninogenica]|uniref:hypothetical protein n=1 Tax=Prevotella melaninogenica TaxID=28132 RepID=UPI001C5D0780|nr:hypothetical protein [Prevotella melaninogenica]MBW4733632.1 hypothetical protein [Prevotella melaninogenica]MBW4736462.1 hypothetical protein [Prevotella melaninogenica]MBW4879788.1 hypothetical protein [Prevotella melaninogenica]
MKTKILLPLICMAISLFTASCSSDDIVSPEAKEQMLTLTVSAGTEDDAAATRAELVEAEGSKSPWKWETGDKLMLVITNAGQKTVHTLDLKAAKRDGLSGEFEGQVPASSITENSTYRFFYVGKTTDGSADRTISASDLSAGNINIDLTQQTGELKDLKKNCVLMGTGNVVATTGGKAITEGSVILKNLFAVAHFAITANDNTPLTKVGLRGKGVYASANVDLSTGAVTGVSEIGTEIDPEENIFFPAGKTDFYVTFVPGSVAPSFDGYYADSYTSVVTSTPQTRNYDADKSFVYYKDAKAKFSVSDNQQVAITNGNMQYVMPIATYTYNMNAKTLDANKLIRWKQLVPLKLKGTRTVHPGYYRLAPEQWETAMPKNTRTGGTYTYNTVTVDGKEYVSPEVYRYFDLPSWGTIDYPTLIDNTFTASASAVAQTDFGNKLKVGNKVTRTMTYDEWSYLMPNTVNIGLTPGNRVWGTGLLNINKRAKWARCFIDENGNGTRDTNPAELRGYLIFPDAMTMDEAKAIFTITNPEIGKWSVANNNPTTFAKIKSSGAVFIPLSAYRAKGSAKLEQWGNHGNYATSQYSGNKMLHLKITDVDAGSFLMIDATSAPDQGCMNRLVQNY